MATRLPSFLRRAGAAAPAPEPAATQPEVPAEVPVPTIFRARPPELLTKPKAVGKAKPAAPQQPSIFKAAAPKLVEPPRPAVTLPQPAAHSGYRILPLARLAQGGRWRTEAMRSYSFPVLLWFTRGQGRITVAGVTRGFGAHNAVFLPPGTMHGFEMTGQVFGSALFFPQGTDLPLPEQPQHLRFREAVEQAELTGLIDNLQREVERGLPIADRAVMHHAGLLSVWLERQILAQKAPETKDSAAKRLSAAYSALVEREYRSGKSVAEFAAELGVTATHLTRSCNQACGRSAHDILQDRIFFEARRLLRESETPVKDIAAGLGFHSAAYFTRAFQKVAGETPTAFRHRG